jgi:hypothetical protein
MGYVVLLTMPYKDKADKAAQMRRYRKTQKQRLGELEFKLRTLTNFVFEHHHRVVVYNGYRETSKGKVWVKYPDGWKEEGNREEVKS